MCAVMLRQTTVKIERNGLSVLRSASKTPKSSLHTENCMLESGGVMGDVILFPRKQYLLENTSAQLMPFVVRG